jgi:hypothetical protein
MANKPISRKTNVVVQDLKMEVLIYDLTINKAFCLNETSALVYQFSDGTKTVAEISDLMSVKLKTKVSEDLVYLALSELRKEDLLENEAEVFDHFVGLTRRQIIKRVGLASMVMLPVISSLVAPNAALAQSGGTFTIGQSCTAPSQCASGTCHLTLAPNGSLNGNHCCVPGSGLGENGYDLGNTTNQAGCNTLAPNNCCSGTATYNGTSCICN